MWQISRVVYMAEVVKNGFIYARCLFPFSVNVGGPRQRKRFAIYGFDRLFYLSGQEPRFVTLFGFSHRRPDSQSRCILYFYLPTRCPTLRGVKGALGDWGLTYELKSSKT